MTPRRVGGDTLILASVPDGASFRHPGYKLGADIAEKGDLVEHGGRVIGIVTGAGEGDGEGRHMIATFAAVSELKTDWYELIPDLRSRYAKQVRDLKAELRETKLSTESGSTRFEEVSILDFAEDQRGIEFFHSADGSLIPGYAPRRGDVVVRGDGTVGEYLDKGRARVVTGVVGAALTALHQSGDHGEMASRLRTHIAAVEEMATGA